VRQYRLEPLILPATTQTGTPAVPTACQARPSRRGAKRAVQRSLLAPSAARSSHDVCLVLPSGNSPHQRPQLWHCARGRELSERQAAAASSQLQCNGDSQAEAVCGAWAAASRAWALAARRISTSGLANSPSPVRSTWNRPPVFTWLGPNWLSRRAASAAVSPWAATAGAMPGAVGGITWERSLSGAGPGLVTIGRSPWSVTSPPAGCELRAPESRGDCGDGRPSG
jgi:hypothetical protein